MKFGSVCSGVEAASVPWEPLGWKAQWFSEIEKFPSSVLAHHYPDVPNLGDMTKIHETDIFNEKPIDLLVGGTPCQSFSVAGLRKGMDDPRGNLALVYLALVARKRPRWIVWENVPGVLSSNGGRDFGAFLGGLAKLGYGFAYRVLDAQYFGVAQRRRRVFVIGYSGDWRPAAAVLFERHSMQGYSAPRRKTGKAVASLTANGVGTCGAHDNQGQGGHLIPHAFKMRGGCEGGGKGYLGQDELAFTLSTSQDQHIAHTLRGNGYDASEDGTVKGIPLVTTYDRQSSGEYGTSPVASTVSARDYKGASDLICGLGVRRLTPMECERLQGFPDNYTLINYRGKPAADGPRYKSMGNSMAVPVMAWHGHRIQMFEDGKL